MGGVHNGVGKIAIVGEQQQALGLAVQATDGMHRYAYAAHQLLNALAPFFICHSGDVATRLM